MCTNALTSPHIYIYLRKINKLRIFCFPAVCAYTFNNTIVWRLHWPRSQPLRAKVDTTKLVTF